MKNLYKVVAESKFRGIYKNPEIQTGNEKSSTALTKTNGAKKVAEAKKDIKTMPDGDKSKVLAKIGEKKITKKDAEDTINTFLSFGGINLENIKDSFTLLFGDLDEVLGLLNGEKDEDEDEDEKVNENISKNRKRIVSKALFWCKGNIIAGAEDCTDWVSKLYTSLGIDGGADGGDIVYNGGITKRSGKYYARRKAGLSDINKAKAGDYLMIKNGNNQTGSHGVVVLDNLGGGRVKVASWGGSGKPKTEIYNLNSGETPKVRSRTSDGDRIGELLRIRNPKGVA